MGNRIKGRVKKKSLRAAIGSSAGSKRKLTRMGKKQKREHSGLEASFIGRSKCLKMLQITIKDFRRLCILKGIYPREPLGRVPGKKKGQTFYHIKDIKAIAHEPVLEKFRDFRAFMKKVRRAAGRNEVDEAARKNSLVPTYTLYHLVKERYPRFSDALSDMDDALTLTYLFAALPSTVGVKANVINKAKTLAAAWGAYCATTSAITKGFISVKGVYLEASIHGMPIRWIVPHSFTQHLPEDVDFRVMRTFLEFYETMLNFVMYKLYNGIGVRYPFPLKELGGQAIGSTSAVLGANLRALTNALNQAKGGVTDAVTESIKETKEVDESTKKLKSGKKHNKELVKSVGAALNKLSEDATEDEDDDDDSVDIAGPLQAALDNVAEEEARAAVPSVGAESNDDTVKRRRLFEGLTFFLSREVPRGYLELVCLAYGAKVGWEGEDSPISIKDPSITHHVVDRPNLPANYGSLPQSREHIQPQWILDCANFMFILPIAKYSLGADLPPHLSPWVDDEEEGYKPAYADEIARLKNGEVIEETDQAAKPEDSEVSDEEEMKEEIDVNEEDDVKEEEEEDEEVVKKRKQKKRKKEEEEAHVMAKSMMGRKALHLYERMQHGISKKKAKVDELNKRREDAGRLEELNKGREDLEYPKGKDPAGRTALKQKVVRLKKERKAVEATYVSASKGGTMKKSKKRRST